MSVHRSNVARNFVFRLLCFFSSFSIFSGKFVEEIAIGGILRVSQVILIVCVLAAPSVLFFGLYRRGRCKYVYWIVAVGLIALITGLFFGEGEPVAALSSAGVYLYPIFFLYGYYSIHNFRRLKVLCSYVGIAVFGGMILFIAVEVYSTGALPFGVHLSSDIVPVAGAGMLGFIAGNGLRTKKNFLLAVLIFSFLAMVQTRGLMLSAAFAFVLKYWVFNRREGDRGFRAAVLPVVLLILYVLSLIIISAVLPSLIASADDNVGSFNVAYRFLMLQDIALEILRNPLFGHGIVPFFPRSVLEFFPESDFGSVNPHNSYILLLYYSGIVGFLPFAGLIRGLWLDFFAGETGASRYVKSVSLGVLVVAMVAFTTPIWELHYISPLLWLVIGGIYRNKLAFAGFAA